MKKSIMSWSWILMVLFFTLSVVDIRFGILGIFCMVTPIYLAIKGGGRVHCVKYCPRGSMFSIFLEKISFKNNLPKAINNKLVKNAMLIWMIGMFSISLIMAGGNFTKTAFAIIRMMAMSTIVGIIMGIIYKPRSWCVICPMGYSTGMIEASQKRKKSAA